MPILLQHRLDPASRLIRLILAEYGVEPELEDVSHWRRDDRLTDINPAATVPVLLDKDLPPLIGLSAVLHFVENEHAPAEGAGLVPVDVADRAEMWRMYDWANIRLNDEVTRYILDEKIGKRELKHGAPDASSSRAAKVNLGEHMQYFAYLFATRRWLAGNAMTIADLALAAHLSALDYLGEVPWDEYDEVKLWFARIKSRPGFRTLLADRVVGMLPSRTYADLDF